MIIISSLKKAFDSPIIVESDAGVAQLVEQLIRNQQVVGSNPLPGWLI